MTSTESSVVPPLVTSGPPKGFFIGAAYSARSMWRQRELLVLLVRREIKSRYKDSSLGMVWSLLRPLTQLLIYYLAIGKVLGGERSVHDYAIFVFTGLTVWTLFADILSGTTNSIVANSGLIKKVYLPREIFPLASVGSALFNFAIQFLILVLATIVLGRTPIHIQLLYLPLALVVMLLFSFSVGLLLSAANVYLRDFQHLVEVLLLVLFWASPIVYSYTLVHNFLHGNFFEQLYLWNPVTLVVLGFQKAMWLSGASQTWPDHLALRLGIVGLASIILLWIAQRVFARLEGNFAQEL